MEMAKTGLQNETRGTIQNGNKEKEKRGGKI